MKKYKVEFVQTETFVVDVYAENEKQATEKAEQEWERGSYQETGDLTLEVGTIYEVTNTDDPFYAECENKDGNGNACYDCENGGVCGATPDEPEVKTIPVKCECGNPTMYWCAECESNSENECCDNCGERAILDEDYHLNCNK